MFQSVNQTGVGPMTWRHLFDDEDQARAFASAFRKAMTETSTSSGGAFIADEFFPALVRSTELFGVFRRLATRAGLGDSVRHVPKEVNELTTAWLDEGQTFNLSAFGTGRVELRVKKLGAMVRLSNELIEDADLDMAAVVARKIGEAFAKTEDNVGMNGDGGSAFGRHVGILQSSDVAAVTLGATKTTFADVSYNKLVELEASVDEGVIENARYFMHMTIYKLIKQMADTQGLPIIGQQLVNVGGSTIFRPTINGHIVEFMRMMPAASSSAADKPFVAFGDLSYVYFGQKGVEEIALSRHPEFTSENTLIRGTERVHLMLADGKALARLKTAAS